jgi:hypothetical protein
MLRIVTDSINCLIVKLQLFVYYKHGMYSFQSSIHRLANLGSMGKFNVVSGSKPINN